MPNVKGTHHVAVQVTDLAAAERFYNGILGLAVIQRWPAADGSLRSLWLATGDGSFLALEKASREASRPSEHPFHDTGAGWHLVALRIAPAERAAWEQHLTESGVEVVHRSRWTLYVRDPDGNRVGLSHHPFEG